MRIIIPIVRSLSMCVLALAGCAPVESASDSLGRSSTVPAIQTRHVYALFLNSPNDPLLVTRFGAVCEYAKKNGFANSQYYAAFSSGEGIARDIRQIRASDPHARICLIAWSGASTYAFDAAQILARERAGIDSIIYLDSQWLIDFRLNNQRHPTNVGRVLLLYREGHNPPTGLPNAITRVIPTTDHLAVATNPVTVDYIMDELRRLTY